MIILRNKYFSNKKKAEEGNAGKMALSSLGVIGGTEIGDRILNKSIKKSDMKLEDHKDLIDKMIKDNKVKVDYSKKYWPRTAYLKYHPITGQIIDTVSIGDDKRGPEALAHELGHRHYLNNPKSGKIGRYVHKIANKEDSIGNLSILAGGILSGKRKAEKEILEGKKESTSEKIVPHVITGSLYLPTLAAEGAASLKGIRILKKSGASKEVINRARKNLLKYWGTYATDIPAAIGIQELVKSGSYKINKNKLKKKLDKEKKSTLDKT